MPQRTFAFSSMVITSEEHFSAVVITYPEGDYSHVLNTTNLTQIEFTSLGDFTAAPPGSGTDRRIQDSYRKIIDVDYTQPIFGIPLGATISKIVYRITQFYNLSADTTVNNPAEQAHAGIYVQFAPSIIGVNIGQQQVGGTASITANDTSSGNPDLIIFDDPDNPISRAQLISSYGTITLSVQVMAQSSSPGLVTGITEANCVISAGISSFQVIVTYQDSPIQWTLNPKVKDEENPEDTIYYITDLANDGVAIPLDTITSLTAHYTSGSIAVPFTLTNTPPNPLDPNGYWIYFTLPAAIPPGEDVVIVATGTQFSGTTHVGLIYAILVDGSGIYRLIPGQTFDRYYDRAVDPVETIDLKIPDPFGRTGFF